MVEIMKNHQLPKPELTKHLAALLLLCTTAAMAARVDLQVVVVAEAQLFKDNRLRLTLDEGRIVETVRHPTDEQWLRVRYLGTVYEARRASFKPEWEAHSDLKRRLAACDQQIADTTRKIDNNDERMCELHNAMAFIRYDSTVRYKIPVVKPPRMQADKNGFFQGMIQGKNYPHYKPVTTYRYVPKIAWSRAKNLARRWEREAEELEKETEEWRNRRGRAIVERARVEAAQQRLTGRFEAFRQLGGDYLIQAYVAIDDRADLYKDKLTRHKLEKYDVVLAKPDPKYDDWLRVRFNDQWYGSREKHFRQRYLMERDLGMRRVELQQRIEDIQRQITLSENHEQTLRTLQLDLEYRRHLTQVPAIQPRQPVARPGGLDYSVATCPSGAVEEVSSSRAHSLIRVWEHDIEDLQEQQAKAQQAIDKMREQSARLEHFAAQLERNIEKLSLETLMNLSP